MQSSFTLSTAEREALNRADTPEHERVRLYARDLRSTAEAYAVAADAPGLRKDAARYLYAESMRLTRESGFYFDRADELERPI